MKGKVNLKISPELGQKLEQYLTKTAFSSLDELAEYILFQYLEQKNEHRFLGATPQESEEIKKRLKNLGYL